MLLLGLISSKSLLVEYYLVTIISTYKTILYFYALIMGLSYFFITRRYRLTVVRKLLFNIYSRLLFSFGCVCSISALPVCSSGTIVIVSDSKSCWIHFLAMLQLVLLHRIRIYHTFHHRELSPYSCYELSPCGEKLREPPWNLHPTDADFGWLRHIPNYDVSGLISS